MVPAMRVYHREGAGRPVRVAWTLEELGEPYELTVVAGEDRHGADYRARHPLGKVPALEDEHGAVFESAAICLHLADQKPELGLVPPLGSHERALVYQWTVFAPAELEPSLIETWSFTSAGDAPERAERAHKRFVAAMTAVGDSLGEREYLLGDQFTVADVLVGTALAFTTKVGISDQLPANLTAYVGRLAGREAFQRASERIAGASAAG
jgi:glutathione S-transferase